VLLLHALNVPLLGSSDHVVSEAIYLEDPEGNGVEFYYDKPTDQWYDDSGALRMGTFPLSIPDLLAELDGEVRAAAADHARRIRPGGRQGFEAELTNTVPPAIAADPAITIGHVHLKTADLGESESFWTNEVGLAVTCQYPLVASFLARGAYHHHIGINRFSDWTSPIDGVPGLAAMEIELSDPADASHRTAPARSIQKYLTSPEKVDVITTVADPR
jgi:catechol 2,3-dioxygenase